jgi:aryl-alcohol dehydrogenase-like predicted oxidoreductase|eukprot:SAG25_NODE_641_length_6226_cov_185.137914_6_plen_193_part_00
MSFRVRAAPPDLSTYMIGCAPLAVTDTSSWAPGGWAPISDEAADAAIAEALRCGLTQFDTAPLYNNGISESRLGHGLAAAGGAAATEAQIWTKCGKLVRGQPGDPPSMDGLTVDGMRADFTAKGGRASFDESTARLQVPSLAGLRIHDPVRAPDTQQNQTTCCDYCVACLVRRCRMTSGNEASMPRWHLTVY